MILIYKRPDVGDGYVGVLTPPQASASWLIAVPLGRDQVREAALLRGVSQADIDEVLTAADIQRFGCVINLRAELEIQAEMQSFGGPMLLCKCGEGYVGFVPPTRYPQRPVPANLKTNWVFTRPIPRNEVADGMYARGHHGQDVWDLISFADEHGWSFG